VANDERAWRSDPTAVIEPGATIGSGTAVWHHAHVRTGAVIGSGCTLGKNVFVDEGVTIGDRVKVQNNVSIYRGVDVHDEVFLGPSCVFTNDLFPRAGNPSWELVATVVETGASVGANATIVCGHRLGAWCMVAAGSVVTRDVAPHQLVRGNPARPAGWVCRCGRLASREVDPPASFECDRCGGDA
jgi:UDP-2-acetamido-3-amino-2,3-dideoxy-glucuronate N-acetyltransferase